MRVLWMFPATVLFIGVAALWWKVTVVISVLYFLVWLARAPIRQQKAEVVARADQQHHWVLSGDPRGTYGMYTPREVS